MDDGAQAARGRPRAAVSADVAAVALRMFTRDGYDETTMDDIARAVGISRPTLFRYFPSKADIVWDRYVEEASELRASLAAADITAPPLTVLCELLPRLLRYDDGDLDLLRTQVTIIASVAAVRARSDARTAEWISIVAEYIARRTNGVETDLLPQVMSRCLWSVGWTALTHWAASSATSPSEALEAAFSALQHGFSLDSLTLRSSAIEH